MSAICPVCQRPAGDCICGTPPSDRPPELVADVVGVLLTVLLGVVLGGLFYLAWEW